jgi:hypothetical protein
LIAAPAQDTSAAMSSARKIKVAEKPLYERDFHAWCYAQAELVEAGRVGELDRANIAEELRDLGSEKLRALESAYRVLLMHMLKWDHQAERRSRSWRASIMVQRREVADLLTDNPSLKSKRKRAVARAYEKARIEAAAETSLDDDAFPEACPYSDDDIMTRPFDWPPT